MNPCSKETLREILPVGEKFRPARSFEDFARQVRDAEDDTLPKTYAVERRGGYPYMEGAGNQDVTAPLPARLSAGNEFNIPLYLPESKDGTLTVILSAVKKDAEISISVNGSILENFDMDFSHIDRQIFSPGPQRPSGASYCYTDKPSPLLRICAKVYGELLQSGVNRVGITCSCEGVVERVEVTL